MQKGFSYIAEPVDGSAPCVITLGHRQEAVLGSNKLCNIDDPTIPEQQVSLEADYEKGTISVKQIGPKAAFLDGLSIGRGKELSATNGSEITLVDNGPTYKLKLIASSNGSSSSSSLNDKIVTPVKPPMKKVRLNDDIKWSTADKGSLIISMYGQVEKTISENKSSFKIASFDLDGTLIKTKSGYVFPTDSDDWKLWHPSVKSMLAQCHQDGYLIVVFSNQSSLKLQAKVPSFQSKITNILKTLNVPAVVLIAAHEDINRKPAPGMWHHLTNNILKGKNIDMDNSIFVGDAAGRKDNWKAGKKKDFAITDRLFARNIRIKFLTPDEFFLHEKAADFVEPEFHPGDYSKDVDVNAICKNLSGTNVEVIVMVGLPASGKSKFTKSFLCPKGYIRINRDILGSAIKCTQLLVESLNHKKKVVVDNTNLDVVSRRKIIETAKQHQVTAIRCFVMDVPFRRVLHNNRFRNITETGSLGVSDAVIHSLRKKYQEPSIEEGFLEVIKIPFIPSFGNKTEEELYCYYLVDPK